MQYSSPDTILLLTFHPLCFSASRHGLTTAEAASRLRRHGLNKVEDAKGLSVWKILMRQVSNSLTIVRHFDCNFMLRRQLLLNFESRFWPLPWLYLLESTILSKELSLLPSYCSISLLGKFEIYSFSSFVEFDSPGGRSG